jgi:hypothetical protein
MDSSAPKGKVMKTTNSPGLDTSASERGVSHHGKDMVAQCYFVQLRLRVAGQIGRALAVACETKYD